MTARTAWWCCLLICCFSGIASREDACMQPAGFSASSSSCSKYFYCDSQGVSQEGECEKGKFWNKDLELCDWQENVTCGKGDHGITFICTKSKSSVQAFCGPSKEFHLSSKPDLNCCQLLTV
eukprot:GFUD01062350.1.p1 GENE.GFUD01062350.1~~GFUD01062350.1.p1  ORF type:complete len:122 (-),score=20.78 GFUD01062350.1:381-746(-)